MSGGFYQRPYSAAIGSFQAFPPLAIASPDRDPSIYDVQYRIGTFWLNAASEKLWYLNNQLSPLGVLQSNWIELAAGSFGKLKTINSVGPDITGNVNLTSISSTIVITPNVGANTINIDVNGNVATSYAEDSGTAVPSGNLLHIVGGSGVSTSGAGNTVTITASASVPLTFAENSGTATASANTINVVGTATNGINTTGSGSTVTVGMNSPYADGDFKFQSTSSGALRTLTVENTSNTASSRAVLNHKVAGTSAGDPWAQFTIGTTQSWAIGPKNLDSQTLYINTNNSGSVSPSTGTNTWKMTTGGIRSLPLQPAFLAYLNTTVSNVTGDGTLYTVVFDTKSYDVQTNFSTVTGLFTAPVAGIYMFDSSVSIEGITGAMTNGRIDLLINGANPTTRGWSGNIANISAGGLCTITGAWMKKLNASDTVGIRIAISNGAKVAGITGSASLGGDFGTVFSGALLF